MTSYTHFRAIERDSYDSTEPYVILTALQFDGTGLLALREGIDIMRGDRRATLHVLHVTGPRPENQSAAEQIACARAELRRYVDSLCVGKLKVVCHIRSGPVAETILDTAITIDANLIVVGTHHRLDFRNPAIGSVAERILSDAHCPVLVAVARRRVDASQRPHSRVEVV